MILIGPILLTPESFLDGVNQLVNRKCSNSASLMSISLSNPSMIKSNAEYTVSNNKKIAKLREKLKLPQSSADRILIYSENSELSEALSNSANIKKAVMDWKNGKIKDKDGNKKFKFVVSANDTTDLKRAINGCTLTGLQEQPDGSITGYVYDVYNFDSNFTDMKSCSKDLSFPNKVACFLQKHGFLHNYQILVPIRIKFDKKG
jgi:hypothetical protein